MTSPATTRAPWRARDQVAPLLGWATTALVVVVAQTVTSARIRHEGWWPDAGLGRSWAGHGRVAWDSGVYLTPARYGYRLSDGLEAGFPGYALAIRGVGALLGDQVLAAVCISAGAGLVATMLCWEWFRLRGLEGRDRLVALLLFLVYPYGFLRFGVVYSDSLLLVTVLAVLVLAERRAWVLAGLAGAAATFTRPNALALLPALVVLAGTSSGAISVPDAPGPTGSVRGYLGGLARQLAGTRLRPSRFRARHAGVLLAVAGVGSYAIWLWGHAGDPLYFATIQRTQYGHSPFLHPVTWTKARIFTDVFPSTWLDLVNEVICLVLGLGAFALAPVVGRRVGWGHGVFVLGIAAVSWASTYLFAPSGRYLLPILPIVLLLVAPWLAARPRLLAGAVVAGAAGTLLLTVGFAGAFDLNW